MKTKIILFLSILSSISLFTSCTKTTIEEQGLPFEGKWVLKDRNVVKGGFVSESPYDNSILNTRVTILPNQIIQMADSIDDVFFEEAFNYVDSNQVGWVNIEELNYHRIIRFKIIENDTLYLLNGISSPTFCGIYDKYDKYVRVISN